MQAYRTGGNEFTYSMGTTDCLCSFPLFLQRFHPFRLVKYEAGRNFPCRTLSQCFLLALVHMLRNISQWRALMFDVSSVWWKIQLFQVTFQAIFKLQKVFLANLYPNDHCPVLVGINTTPQCI